MNEARDKAILIGAGICLGVWAGQYAPGWMWSMPVLGAAAAMLYARRAVRRYRSQQTAARLLHHQTENLLRQPASGLRTDSALSVHATPTNPGSATSNDSQVSVAK